MLRPPEPLMTPEKTSPGIASVITSELGAVDPLITEPEPAKLLIYTFAVIAEVSKIPLAPTVTLSDSDMEAPAARVSLPASMVVSPV